MIREPRRSYSDRLNGTDPRGRVCVKGIYAQVCSCKCGCQMFFDTKSAHELNCPACTQRCNGRALTDRTGLQYVYSIEGNPSWNVSAKNYPMLQS